MTQAISAGLSTECSGNSGVKPGWDEGGDCPITVAIQQYQFGVDGGYTILNHSMSYFKNR